MVWLSINPESEPWRRKSAAAAISSSPENQASVFNSIIGVRDCFETRTSVHSASVQLAEHYNNVEALGLDLLSLGTMHADNEEVFHDEETLEDLEDYYEYDLQILKDHFLEACQNRDWTRFNEFVASYSVMSGHE